MIRNIPYVYWTRAELPRRQRSLLRVKDFVPVWIEPAKDYRQILSLVAADGQYEWYLDAEGQILRQVRDENGLHVTPDDIEDVPRDRLFGHYRLRRWWRDHPSSADLGLEPETQLAWSTRSGGPGDFYWIGNAKRDDEVFFREHIIARINMRASLLRHDGSRLLVRAPLPGYVLQVEENRVWLDYWIAPITEGTAPIQAYFAHGTYSLAAEVAKELSSDAELLPSPPTELYDIEDHHPLADWLPLATTLRSMLFGMTEKMRMGDALNERGKAVRQSGYDILDLKWKDRLADALLECAPFIDYPEKLAKAVVMYNPSESPEDFDWEAIQPPPV